MANIQFEQRQVTCKIVYYGPGLSGKTTNLEVIHNKAPKNARGDMTTIPTRGDRTLYFDYMPLDVGQVAGMKTTFQLYTVPGQIYYNNTRKLVLRDVDGVVFVADCNPAKMPENVESLQNLRENLAAMDKSLDDIPLVMQYNKRDLPNAIPVTEINAALNQRNVPFVESIAKDGQGVFATLKQIGKLVIDVISQQQQAPEALRRRTAAATGRAPIPAAPIATAAPSAPMSQPPVAQPAMAMPVHEGSPPPPPRPETRPIQRRASAAETKPLAPIGPPVRNLAAAKTAPLPLTRQVPVAPPPPGPGTRQAPAQGAPARQMPVQAAAKTGQRPAGRQGPSARTRPGARGEFPAGTGRTRAGRRPGRGEPPAEDELTEEPQKKGFPFFKLILSLFFLVILGLVGAYVTAMFVPQFNQVLHQRLPVQIRPYLPPLLDASAQPDQTKTKPATQEPAQEDEDTPVDAAPKQDPPADPVAAPTPATAPVDTPANP